MKIKRAEKAYLESEVTEIGRRLEELRNRVQNLSTGDDSGQATRIVQMRVSILDATHRLVAYLWGVRCADIQTGDPSDAK